MSTKSVTQQTFQSSVLESDQLVVVDFWATWCGPCKMLSPIVDELSDEIGDVNFVKIDADQAQDLVNAYTIMGIPTLLFFKHGEVVERLSGLRSKAEIEKVIQTHQS